jgi:hypothetical protein
MAVKVSYGIAMPWKVLACVLAVILLPTGVAAQPQPAEVRTFSTACGGDYESAVWRRWDEGGSDFATQVLDRRLVNSGDTYVLYDLQTWFHNLQAMAVRCHRLARQREFASLVKRAYGELSFFGGETGGRAWVCRGGVVCNDKNRLLGKEVLLTSVQFLAFAMSVARELDQAQQNVSDQEFARESSRIAVEHLVRWANLSARLSVRKRISATPSDVRDESSSLFFSDKDLWQIAIYANLAGVLAMQPQLAKSVGLDEPAFASIREHFALLLHLFKARTVVSRVSEPRGGSVIVAELDAGFWRLYKDNRYAAYTGKQKPVTCQKDHLGIAVPTSSVDASGIPVVRGIGWDLSHARRLVHAFAAIERNRVAISSVFGVHPDDLPSPEVMSDFARQLRLKVWNQDRNRPLFANYVSGANGWYRVAYDNGTGRCMEGYPPYALTDAFPTGGFATWAIFDPGLRGLGERLYDLTRSSDPDDQAFVNTYYSNLGINAGVNARMLAEIMFWPTLVGY